MHSSKMSEELKTTSRGQDIYKCRSYRFGGGTLQQLTSVYKIEWNRAKNNTKVTSIPAKKFRGARSEEQKLGCIQKRRT